MHGRLLQHKFDFIDLRFDRLVLPHVDVRWSMSHGLDRVPMMTRDGSRVVEAMKHVQGLFPWLLRGVDFDNDSWPIQGTARRPS
jgi:hypothetical protein